MVYLILQKKAGLTYKVYTSNIEPKLQSTRKYSQCSTGHQEM